MRSTRFTGNSPLAISFAKSCVSVNSPNFPVAMSISILDARIPAEVLFTSASIASRTSSGSFCLLSIATCCFRLAPSVFRYSKTRRISSGKFSSMSSGWVRKVNVQAFISAPSSPTTSWFAASLRMDSLIFFSISFGSSLESLVLINFTPSSPVLSTISKPSIWLVWVTDVSFVGALPDAST